jgi:hypothetical protein
MYVMFETGLGGRLELSGASSNSNGNDNGNENHVVVPETFCVNAAMLAMSSYILLPLAMPILIFLPALPAASIIMAPMLVATTFLLADSMSERLEKLKASLVATAFSLANSMLERLEKRGSHVDAQVPEIELMPLQSAPNPEDSNRELVEVVEEEGVADDNTSFLRRNVKLNMALGALGYAVLPFVMPHLLAACSLAQLITISLLPAIFCFAAAAPLFLDEKSEGANITSADAVGAYVSNTPEGHEVVR